MVIQRTGSGQAPLLAVLEQERSEGFTGAGFGIAWPLVIQIAGWVIQGIGLGLSVRESIQDAKGKVPSGEEVRPSDIRPVAEQVAAADPSGRSASYWEQQLKEGFGMGVPEPCPPGFYRDPTTGACLEVKKAGMFEKLPTWAWVLIGLGGFWFLTQSGMLRMMGAGRGLQGAGCRDREGKFVPVPQCRRRRKV